MTPTTVERAPTLRTGGYVVDFWGSGFEVAARMGLVPEILEKGSTVREVRVVNRNGRRVSGFPAETSARATGGRFTSLPDLASAIFSAVAKVETIFGDRIDRIEQNTKDVVVRFERNASRTFDLLVGADGLHSRVRELVFGPEHFSERYLGIKVAVFAVEGYRPRDRARVSHVLGGRPADIAVRHAERSHHVPLHVCRSGSCRTLRRAGSEGGLAGAVPLQRRCDADASICPR